jgi:hypothetical protein
MAKEINLTPVGLTVPGGAERVAKALQIFNSCTAEVANIAEHFVSKYDAELGEANIGAGDGDREEFREDVLELHDAITFRRFAQEEFLRAVAGATPLPNLDRAAELLQAKYREQYPDADGSEVRA